MINAVVSRLHRTLVTALHERGEGSLERPVTVAEIYQDLVPYRVIRTALGVELNADYEHALLRLLAGADGLVKLEPASAREELRRELESPNPNVGLFRKFAACDVWVAAPVVESSVAPDRTAPDRVEPAGAVLGGWRAPVDDALAAEDPPSPDGNRETTARDRIQAPAALSARAGTACTFCGEAVPTDRTVRYCPHCGKDQNQRPCDRCGEALEPGWRFCIACGTAAAESGVLGRS